MKSITDKVFLIIFFTFLFVPLSHIDTNTISKQENRTLAKINPIIINKKINYNFPREISAWFDDRFFLRQQFISLYNKKYLFTKKSTKNVVIGKDGWLYLGWKRAIQSYSNSNLFKESELAQITKYFSDINDFCIKHNKQFYFVIAPDKSRIYPEYYDENIKQKGTISKAEQLSEYILNNSNVKVIYLKNSLIKNKGNNLLYYKQDTHWNTLGAYYGYLEIMRALRIEPYKVKKYKKIEYFGDLNDMLDESMKIKISEKYIVPDTSDIDAKCNTKEEDNIKITNCTSINKKHSLLMYQDSFINSLRNYMAESFYKSKFIWRYDASFSDFGDEDIVIYEMVERELASLIKISKGNK